MGAGGQSIHPMDSKKQDQSRIVKRAPCEKPPFTITQIKKAIPPRCFKRSLIRSSAYVVFDLSIAFALYYVATHYFPLLPYGLHFITWPIYIFAQGCVLTGVWVIAHECGHHAFSEYNLINDILGLILHSCLLVPYFSWQISHRRHHANTGSMETDEVYIPKTKSNLQWFSKYLSFNPLGRFVVLTITLTLGFPLYLLFNVSGRKYKRFTSHYDPYGPLYNNQEKILIFISDVAILAVFFGLYHLALAKGLGWVLCLYGGPLMVVNAFFVLITYLHHTHLALPHYDSSEWEWLRGALSTMDRDYGILNKVFHNTANTHVSHHLFPTIPHYHALEATKAIKPVLGDYYQFDGTPIYKALWREAKECIYVEPHESSHSKGVFWYNYKM